MKEIRIHGRGGQGSVTAAELLAVCKRVQKESNRNGYREEINGGESMQPWMWLLVLGFAGLMFLSAL